MKFLVIYIYMIINVMTFANSYNYPYTNPYLATVLSTPLKDMPEFKPVSYKEIKLPSDNSNTPKNLWYLDEFKFGLMAQEERSPLVFLFAGTGAKYNSKKMETMGSILYEKGFSVVMLPTSFDYNYLVSMSKTHAPGILGEDGEEIYELMKKVMKKIEKKVNYSDLYVTGYSLGGSISLILGEIDSRKKYFNFKRIVSINPTVNLYDSATMLDKLLDDNIHSERELDELLRKIIMGVIEYGDKTGGVSFDENSIYPLFKSLDMDEKDLKILIGLAFRFIAIDINYITDLMTRSGVYSDPTKKAKKYESMSQYYSSINFSSFEKYIEKIGYPVYEKTHPGITLEEVIKQSDLKSIDSYLKTATNIAVITNEDELILTKDNLDYLKQTLGNKLKVYPYGGHCGNMFYKDNIDFMIEYFIRGDIK